MNTIPAKPISIAAALATAAFAILFGSVRLTNAQTSRRPSSAPPSGPVRPSPGGLKTPRTQRPPSVGERQFKILEMEREAAKPRTPEEEKLALAQIAEDYERIQIINNKMMGATMSAKVPNYGAVAETAAEIKKRATRVLDNLRLPQPDAEQAAKKPEHKQVTDAAQMKVALLSLDETIMSFVRNPIFKNTDVVNVEEAIKLRRDLETIIEFSHLIGKDAERLSKSSDKPH
ncbi:MAG TPA: hypothetical protein VFH31_09945 [Pyrinomonadaceae bacterium]|nr:hypothetical protein [Pyrinomonadaceae bacterium]